MTGSSNIGFSTASQMSRVASRVGVPWFRILWALLGALIVAAGGYAALMFDIRGTWSVLVLIQLLAVPFVRAATALGLTSDSWVSFGLLLSGGLWWVLLFAVFTVVSRRHGAARAA